MARALASTLAVMLLGVVTVVLATALPAAGHSTMLQASPGPSQIAGGPIEVVDLTFTEPVSEAEVRVKNGDGEFLAGSMEVAEGQIIRFAFDEPLNEPGEYEVDFELISWDGDPVDGDYGFTLDPTAPPPVRLLRDDAVASASTGDGDTSDEAGASTDATDGASGGRTFATILALVALLVAVVAVAVTALRWSGRRSETRSERPSVTPSDD